MAPRVASVPFASSRAPRPESAPMHVPISGNRKSAQRKNPYISPAPNAAPRTAPKMPMPRLYSPATFGFGAAGTADRIGAIALGADGIGGGATAAGAGAGRLIRSPPTGAGSAMDGAGGLGTICDSMSLAARVPSTPQAGQLTVIGIRPPTGSTSNLYFWPHSQTTFSSIRAPFQISSVANGKICAEINPGPIPVSTRFFAPAILRFAALPTAHRQRFGNQKPAGQRLKPEITSKT